MKLTAYIFFYSVFSISPALAGPLLIIEPDSVPEGTDIRNAFRRVTLSVDGDSTREVRAVDGFDAFNGRNLATTGTLVFGYSPTLPHATGEGKVWDEDTFGLLRADFKRLADTPTLCQRTGLLGACRGAAKARRSRRRRTAPLASLITV
jgi:hypothetical protein